MLVATAYYLKHFGSGRELYALGSNPEAARLAGIPVRKRILAAYTFCGALAGLAGAMYLARFGNVDSGTGNGYELTVVSAVVVGGVVFTGGSGSVYGAALGALLLTSINSVLPALGVSSVWVLAINGILLILAIAVDRVVALRVADRPEEEERPPWLTPPSRAPSAGTRSSAPSSSCVLLLSFGFVDGFGNALNLSFLIGNTLPIALIALPMTLLVVAGEIDLSVASTAGLSGAVMGALWNQGMTIETIIPLCLLLGVVCGLVNGLLVTRLGLPSLAVTIGTLAAYRGIAQIILGSDAVTDFPAQYLDFAAGRIGDTFVPQAFLPFLALLAIAVVVLHATPFGRSLFAIGANEEAARFAGIRVRRQKLILFVATGLMASLTGVFWALHYASARYDNATGLELSVVAAVLLGGIDFDGGKGTLGGAIAGVFLLGALQNVMSLQDVSAQSQIVVTGVLLVVSVLGPRVARQISVARAGPQSRLGAGPPRRLRRPRNRSAHPRKGISTMRKSSDPPCLRGARRRHLPRPGRHRLRRHHQERRQGRRPARPPRPARPTRTRPPRRA